MYVCVCHAITEKQIQRAADQGVSSLDELSARLGVATGCGCCAGLASQVLADARKHQSSHVHGYPQGRSEARWYSVA